MSEASGKRQNGEKELGESEGFWSGLVAELRLPFPFSVFLAIPAFVFGIAAFWETHKEALEATGLSE
jgi:hypothetical protein